MQKLIEAARRSLDVDQKAADAGLRDNPKTLTVGTTSTRPPSAGDPATLDRCGD